MKRMGISSLEAGPRIGKILAVMALAVAPMVAFAGEGLVSATSIVIAAPQAATDSAKDSELVAIGGTKLKAIGGTRLKAIGGTKLKAIGGTKLKAIGGTKLKAIGGTKLKAIGGTKLKAIGGTKLKAIGGTKLKAIGGTKLKAIGGTKLKAIGGTKLKAIGGTKLKAIGSVAVASDASGLLPSSGHLSTAPKIQWAGGTYDWLLAGPVSVTESGEISMLGNSFSPLDVDASALEGALADGAYVIALGTDEEGTGVLFAGDEAYVAGASEVIVGGTVAWTDDAVGRFGLSNGITVDYAALLADDSSALASVGDFVYVRGQHY
jgi:hypothetical protein